MWKKLRHLLMHDWDSWKDKGRFEVFARRSDSDGTLLYRYPIGTMLVQIRYCRSCGLAKSREVPSTTRS